MEERQPGATPATLAIDIGGTGLKAAVLDSSPLGGHRARRVETRYPCAPAALLAQLHELVDPLPPWDRISVGFPGVVRKGRVLTAPHFVTTAGPGSAVDDGLVALWQRFDLTAAISHAFAKPARVLNDADLQGLDVVQGSGVEVVVTLGTGFGSAVFVDGALAAHLELAQFPFRHNQTFNEQLGDAARKKAGNRKWNARVGRAITNLRTLLLFDHLYLGGGNARHLDLELAADTTIVDPNAGILAGVRLWDLAVVP
jgi:polyphosphate glucokinase